MSNPILKIAKKTKLIPSIPIKRGGLLLGYSKNKRRAYFVDSDTHSLIIGATRSGKTRHIILPSIALQALAGESMVNTDPKGELLMFTSPFLKSMDYEVVSIDFEYPLKSNRYNFLQQVIDSVEKDDIPAAIDKTWDIVSALVGETKGEKIWTNGECAIIACSILAVVVDNIHRPQFQNLTNVYHFIGKMCTEVNKKLPLTSYLREMPDNHPAKSLVDISNVAPSRTRGSFFTAALTTLRLFTNPLIHDMTCITDFDFYGTGLNKQALFIVLPDEKSTYYSLASLFCSLHYQAMVGIAKRNGGRLPRQVNYNLDEIGNFTKIPDFSKMLTVGGGRGMRFNLSLQEFKQLDEVYGENFSKVIRNNCENWIYLQAESEETRNEISNKMGSYTIKSHSYSQQSSGTNSYSTSYNLTGRKLLTPEEIKNIRRPYQLVTSRSNPCIMYAPDISQTIFNKLYGLGDEGYNRELFMKRNDERPSRTINNNSIPLWNIWSRYSSSSNDASEVNDDINSFSTSVKGRNYTVERKR